MSAFMNGSGSGTSLSGALASGNDLTKGIDVGQGGGDMSGLTQPMGSQGLGNTNANTYAFQLPQGMQEAIAGDNTMAPTAGLTGVQSGMTMPDYAAASTGSGSYDSNNTTGNLGALAAGGMKMSKDLMDQKGPQGGSGRVMMQAKQFGAPVIALPMASGSNAGNSLLQMMQRYQPGNVVGTNTGSGYGNR